MIRFFLVERAGTAERNRAGVAEYFPLALRRLDGERRICAVDSLACDEATILTVEGQCVEMRYFRHVIFNSREASYACFHTVASASIVATSSGARWADKR